MYRRMFGYMRPYLPFFSLSVALSLVVIALEALSLWFSMPLVKTLFLPGTEVTPEQAFSLRHAYDFLKYQTYLFLQQYNPVTSLKIVCVLIGVSRLAMNAVT